MIPVGTLCIIKHTSKQRANEFIGKTCTVVKYIEQDKFKHDCVVKMADGEEVLAAEKCLLPITPPEDQTQMKIILNQKVSI